ncbi:MAG: undecaprenyldiphospho-muramoylpentapeptide beta-N-acetylglucosaminyltransferase [Acidimicrobiales bacterium]|jgi:UDP-N-acetylglucosamine--N-acetylmuramyl-(pentapeptide) pyrophosphoryl-undecaprenol N-acetylglucosamine transferase
MTEPAGQVWAVIAGGGTSGHVHPALAIAGELVRRGRSKDEIHFIGSRRGLEAELVPEHGYGLTALPGRGIQRSISRENVKSIVALGSAAILAWRTLRRLRPAVVVSVGGYASLPALQAAALLRIPIIVTEQNTVPGAANRFGSRWAKACAVAFATTELPKAVHTGNPLLGGILDVDRSDPLAVAQAKERLGVDPERRLVAAFGGSLGARRINQAVVDATMALADRDDLTVRHIIGDRDWDLFGSHSVDGPLQYQAVRYERAMNDVYAAADFVVCRSGATSVCEIAETGTPAVFVPLPSAPGDHQTKNAQALTVNGGGLLVKDDELDGSKVVDLVNDLLADPHRLADMSMRAGEQARPNAAADIANLIETHARAR